MPWVYKTPLPHVCYPPTTVTFFGYRADINSLADMYQCSDSRCGKYWVPKPKAWPLRGAKWVEITGEQLEDRLATIREIKRAEEIQRILDKAKEEAS